MGFPGRLLALATYEVTEPATLRISLQAFTDAPTPVNLTSHNYFNLDGSADARDHRLALAADRYLPTDPGLIPTGDIRAVATTPYDFREDRPIRASGIDLDVPLVVRRDRSPLTGARSGCDAVLAGFRRLPATLDDRDVPAAL